MSNATAAAASPVVDVAFLYEAGAAGLAVLVVLTAGALHCAFTGSWKVVHAASGALYARADSQLYG